MLRERVADGFNCHEIPRKLGLLNGLFYFEVSPIWIIFQKLITKSCYQAFFKTKGQDKTSFTFSLKKTNQSFSATYFLSISPNYQRHILGLDQKNELEE